MFELLEAISSYLQTIVWTNCSVTVDFHATEWPSPRSAHARRRLPDCLSLASGTADYITASSTSPAVQPFIRNGVFSVFFLIYLFWLWVRGNK